MTRLLAVDAGNTHTTIGLFDGQLLVENWRMATRIARTGDELWVFLRQFLESSAIPASSLQAVAISSVVPELTLAYAQMSRRRLRLEPLVITYDKVKSLRIAYDPPGSVGADRLCGAVAAFAKYGGPLVIVDMGTATVFDVVSADGVYRGGLIAPGLITAVESLHRNAAMLPRVDLNFPEHVIGSTTEEAIQAGILLGAADMIDGLVARIATELGTGVRVVATGGLSELLQTRCRSLQYVEPDLVLQGIRLIAAQQ